jgi:hypothetical protein
LVEKNEEEHIEMLKKEAIKESVSTKVDRQVIEEAKKQPEDSNESEHELTSVYMKELGKF